MDKSIMKTDYNYHGDVVVFDLDDTLMRERDYVRSGFRLIENNLIEKGLDAEGLAAEMTNILENRGRYFDFLEDWLIKKEGNATRLKSLINIYRTHIPENLDTMPGCMELLEQLNDSGVKIGIITDGRSVTQRAKLKALGFNRFFNTENIIISEETGKDKTAPDNFRHFVSIYPEAKRFFYIADNERKDFLVPNLLGWTTVKIPYCEDNVHEDFINTDKLSQPAYILSSLIEFLSQFTPKGE